MGDQVIDIDCPFVLIPEHYIRSGVLLSGVEYTFIAIPFGDMPLVACLKPSRHVGGAHELVSEEEYAELIMHRDFQRAALNGSAPTNGGRIALEHDLPRVRKYLREWRPNPDDQQ